jgi:glucuronate isomerase
MAVLTASYPDAVTITERAFNGWLNRLAATEGMHILIYRDYLYTAWLSGKAYADSQGL